MAPLPGTRLDGYQRRCARLLRRWAVAAERSWYPMPDEPELGCYGTGYDSWGVQTNQKYVGAMAALAALGPRMEGADPALCDQARARALAALRFSLASHLSGAYHCTDNRQWGHTWISGLGVERMMYGVYLLDSYLQEPDRDGLRRVLTSEADWICYEYELHHLQGVRAGRWAAEGQNRPESNLWNGAVLWRASMMYPEHAHAREWQEQAHRFLLNAISVSADAQDDRLVAGKPIREWHVGDNFFPHYALDHHGYLNVGYMAICLSNAAILHFDLRARGWPIPESLYHHNMDLWQVLRRMVFSDGRLARLGGDSRVRYAYCQEYLLPILPYVGVLGDGQAEALIDAQLALIEAEASFNGDGSFYGRRLTSLLPNEHYYCRLESDRAAALGMLWAYLHQMAERDEAGEALRPATPGAFERSAAGFWCEPEHGAALHRSPTRLASFAWRAHGLGQGLCQPPDDGRLAEWSQNLGGMIRFYGDPGEAPGASGSHRRLLGQRIHAFPGGFATCGAIMEGVAVRIEEGYTGTESAVHQIAFVALPDDHTVVGLEHARTTDHRTYVDQIKGLHLNLPNDLFNGFERRLATARGEVTLSSPPARDEVRGLGGCWANIEGRVGVVGIYGADELVVDRSAARRGGRYETLYVEEICFPCQLGVTSLGPGQVILDAGWAVLSGVGQAGTARFAAVATPLARLGGDLRGVQVTGQDGAAYVVLANWGEDERAQTVDWLEDQESLTDLTTGARHSRNDTVTIGPGDVLVLAVTAGPQGPGAGA